MVSTPTGPGLPQVEMTDDGFFVDASLLGELLALPPAQVQALMRGREITSTCERGEGEHEGQYRLSFSYRGRQARLSIDGTGRILRRSVIDTGERGSKPAS